MIDQMVQAIEGCDRYAGSMLIGGRAVTAADIIPVENPFDERVIAEMPLGDENHAQDALEAAAAAQPGWAAVPAPERGRLVARLADLVVGHAEALARVVVAEQGKPIGQARGEIEAAALFLRYAAEGARRIEGDILPSDAVNEEVWIRRLPHGVVVGLTAWNYPAALAARKLGPALVAGNTFVLKGHEFTPLSGLAIASLAAQAGIPSGVVNVVSGPGRTLGAALVKSPLSNLVTMTGSTRAGREIYAAGAEQIKVLRLELGGKAPFIVMDDADVDAAVQSALTSRFTNCGQVCTCNERMYLHEAIAEQFLDKFVAGARALTIGNPLEDPDLGPKISRGEVDKIEEIVDASVAAGCEVLLEGGPMRSGAYGKGHWYAPTVLAAPNNNVPAMQQEIFGPVVPVVRVDSFEAALELANQSHYGLSAYVYTRDMRRVMQAAGALDFGEIYCNRPNGELVQAFHSGWGQSGLGGEDGKYGFDDYFRKKTMYVNWA